jgi:glycosyltransferase involved in cell wall biosynthesis
MRVSVIIPTFNRRNTVLSTIQTVLEQNYARSDYEVIIVVDGGTDDTEQALRKFDTESRLRVLVQENRGLPGARNSGFRVASGELLIFLDDDMICTREWLRAHVAAHQLSSGRETVGLGAIYIPADHPSSLAAETFRLGQGAEFLRHRDNRIGCGRPMSGALRTRPSRAGYWKVWEASTSASECGRTANWVRGC